MLGLFGLLRLTGRHSAGMHGSSGGGDEGSEHAEVLSYVGQSHHFDFNTTANTAINSVSTTGDGGKQGFAEKQKKLGVLKQDAPKRTDANTAASVTNAGNVKEPYTGNHYHQLSNNDTIAARKISEACKALASVQSKFLSADFSIFEESNTGTYEKAQGSSKESLAGSQNISTTSKKTSNSFSFSFLNNVEKISFSIEDKTPIASNDGIIALEDEDEDGTILDPKESFIDKLED